MSSAISPPARAGRAFALPDVVLPDVVLMLRQHVLTDLQRQRMLTYMPVTRELAQNVSSHDPEVGLRAVAALRTLAEQLEVLQVENARASGWSWQDIAVRLGVTKQTVHRKHGRRIGGR